MPRKRTEFVSPARSPARWRASLALVLATLAILLIGPARAPAEIPDELFVVPKVDVSDPKVRCLTREAVRRLDEVTRVHDQIAATREEIAREIRQLNDSLTKAPRQPGAAAKVREIHKLRSLDIHWHLQNRIIESLLDYLRHLPPCGPGGQPATGSPPPPIFPSDVHPLSQYPETLPVLPRDTPLPPCRGPEGDATLRKLLAEKAELDRLAAELAVAWAKAPKYDNGMAKLSIEESRLSLDVDLRLDRINYWISQYNDLPLCPRETPPAKGNPPPPPLPAGKGVPPRKRGPGLAAPPVVDDSHAGVEDPCAEGVLAALNAARADPAGYAASLNGAGGSSAAEARAFLGGRQPLPALTLDPRLTAAARAHAEDLAARGEVSHAGPGGQGLLERFRAQGLWVTLAGEEIAIGVNSSAGAVRQLIIDDGNPGGPHRRDLFNEHFTLIGIACIEVRGHGRIVVIELSNAPMARDE